MNLRFLFTMGIVACLFLFSCKKEESELEKSEEVVEDVDYRQQYVGEYEFSYFYSFTILISPVTTTIDTATYLGRIEPYLENKIKVDWCPGSNPRSFMVNEDGELVCGNLNQL